MSKTEKFYFVKAMPLNEYLVDFEVIKEDVKKLDRWVMSLEELEARRKEFAAKVDAISDARELSWRKKHRTPCPRRRPALTFREPSRGGEVYLCGDGYHFETLLACVPIARPFITDDEDGNAANKSFRFGEN